MAGLRDDGFKAGYRASQMRSLPASTPSMSAAARDRIPIERDRSITSAAGSWRRRLMLSFHWTTALLVVAMFALGWGRMAIDDLAVRAVWLDVHRLVGLLILAITLARLCSRLILGPVVRHVELPSPLWLASRANHLLLYILLIAMPLLGWAQSSARARHFEIFGVGIPRLMQRDPDMADVLSAWHDTLAWALLALILIHSLAALYHHYVRRDDVLRMMLPGGGR